MDERRAARELQRYAKQFHAGAFATPSARELSAMDVREWEGGCVGVARRMRTTSRRRDWTGEVVEIPAGAHVLTHLARPADAPVPDVDEFDLVVAYQEDHVLRDGLAEQGREITAYQITAASEILALWGREGSGGSIRPEDRVHFGPIGDPLDDDLRAAFAEEVDALDGWADDFPYYSDGTWGALSLRGYRPDPMWGVKPREMGSKWMAAHPGSEEYVPVWTPLVEVCPRITAWVESVEWWGELDRVRFMRMDGRAGRGGKLGRHSDITDKSMGTRDGQMVRFFVPIVTHPAIEMHLWSLDGERTDVHLDAWSLWYLDARRPHAVTNPTDVDRVHLAVDVIVTPAVREMLAGIR